MSSHYEMMIARTSPDPEGDCILWNGVLDEYGYGSQGRKHRKPHRVAWEHAHGPIPGGLQVHHTCLNRRCVNVEHMQLLTLSEHLSLHHRLQTHCIRGHELNEENAWRGGNRRVCRICARIRRRARETQARKQLAAANQRISDLEQTLTEIDGCIAIRPDGLVPSTCSWIRGKIRAALGVAETKQEPPR